MLTIKICGFIVGKCSGSTFNMSSSDEKEDIKDAIENYGVWVCKTKYFELKSELVNCIIQ